MAEAGSKRGPGSRPLERLLLGKPVTPRRAWWLISASSLSLTITGGIVVWLFDPSGFGSLGDSLWWALQTVTTVGYGDVVPHNTLGRVVGSILMVNGIALLSVVTAIVAALLVERGRRRAGLSDDTLAALARIEERLEAIEKRQGRDGG